MSFRFYLSLFILDFECDCGSDSLTQSLFDYPADSMLVKFAILHATHLDQDHPSEDSESLEPAEMWLDQWLEERSGLAPSR